MGKDKILDFNFGDRVALCKEIFTFGNSFLKRCQGGLIFI
jgi:hypothetical protein